jgi:hypothetical protein
MEGDRIGDSEMKLGIVLSSYMKVEVKCMRDMDGIV